jgi:hypothetical protein
VDLYAPIGALQPIKWNKQTIVDHSQKLKTKRLANLMDEIVECLVKAIADAHRTCSGEMLQEWRLLRWSKQSVPHPAPCS